MLTPRLSRLSQQLARLRELDPYGTILFGATEHQYKLNPPTSLETVLAFEAANQVELPEEYREFILQVGNGGAGPYYGLYPLLHPSIKTQKDYVGAGFFSSSPEFLGINWTESWEDYWLSEGIERFVNHIQHRTDEIALCLGTQGCSLQTLLVAKGDCKGEMWHYDYEAFSDMGYGYTPEIIREAIRTPGSVMLYQSEKTASQPIHVYGISPFQSGTVDGLSFLDWYEHWVETGLEFHYLLKPHKD